MEDDRRRQKTIVATTIFTTFNVTTAVPENNSNLGLIVGLSVGIPCGIAVIIAVIVTIICHRRRKREENNSNKHKDFNPKELCTNRTPYVTQDSTNQIYENVPIPRRDDAIYENSPESEDFYETRLPAI
ncbi:uncharacterized protein LOC143930232 isoform X2 [Lithobates pipiens]